MLCGLRVSASSAINIPATRRTGLAGQARISRSACRVLRPWPGRASSSHAPACDRRNRRPPETRGVSSPATISLASRNETSARHAPPTLRRHGGSPARAGSFRLRLISCVAVSDTAERDVYETGPAAAPAGTGGRHTPASSIRIRLHLMSCVTIHATAKRDGHETRLPAGTPRANAPQARNKR